MREVPILRTHTIIKKKKNTHTHARLLKNETLDILLQIIFKNVLVCDYLIRETFKDKDSFYREFRLHPVFSQKTTITLASYKRMS